MWLERAAYWLMSLSFFLFFGVVAMATTFAYARGFKAGRRSNKPSWGVVKNSDGEPVFWYDTDEVAQEAIAAMRERFRDAR